MAIYEFKCPKCYKVVEKMQRYGDSAPVCTTCVSKMIRQVSRTSFALKGGGWYKDSYSKAPPPTEG